MYHKISALVWGTYPVYISVGRENILAEDFHVCFSFTPENFGDVNLTSIKQRPLPSQSLPPHTNSLDSIACDIKGVLK